MFVGKLNELLPIVFRDVVFPSANMITDRSHDGSVEFGHRFGGKTFLTEQLVDTFRVFCGEKLSFGIGPQVFRGARHINRPRRA